MAKARRDGGDIVVEDVHIADTYWKKFRGLMGNDSLQPGQALLLQGDNWIHCFFMKISIDVLFLDKQGHIVYLKEKMQPWTISPPVWQARGVLECYPGTITRCGLAVGQKIEIVS